MPFRKRLADVHVLELHLGKMGTVFPGPRERPGSHIHPDRLFCDPFLHQAAGEKPLRAAQIQRAKVGVAGIPGEDGEHEVVFSLFVRAFRVIPGIGLSEAQIEEARQDPSRKDEAVDEKVPDFRKPPQDSQAPPDFWTGSRAHYHEKASAHEDQLQKSVGEGKGHGLSGRNAQKPEDPHATAFGRAHARGREPKEKGEKGVQIEVDSELAQGKPSTLLKEEIEERPKVMAKEAQPLKEKGKNYVAWAEAKDAVHGFFHVGDLSREILEARPDPFPKTRDEAHESAQPIPAQSKAQCAEDHRDPQKKKAEENPDALGRGKKGKEHPRTRQGKGEEDQAGNHPIPNQSSRKSWDRAPGFSQDKPAAHGLPAQVGDRGKVGDRIPCHGGGENCERPGPNPRGPKQSAPARRPKTEAQELQKEKETQSPKGEGAGFFPNFARTAVKDKPNEYAKAEENETDKKVAPHRKKLSRRSVGKQS